MLEEDKIFRKVFYGWWIVLAISLIHFWGAGTFFYSFTAFFNPIANEFGWSYAAISFAASIRSIEGGIASPIIGFAADRYGPRRLLLIGSLLSGFGFIFLGKINSLGSFYLLFIFLSIGASFLFPVPGWTAVTNWFIIKRGTAIGIVSASIGIGGTLIYFVNWLIGMFGWRDTMAIIGVGMWAIGIPASLIIRHRPEPYNLLPDGGSFSRPIQSHSEYLSGKDQGGDTVDFSARQAIKTKSFWFVALVVTISAATVHAVMVHIMPYLISVNFSRETASIIAALLVIGSTLGRLTIGWLTARVNSRFLLVLLLALQAIGLIILSRSKTLWQTLLFVGLFGPGYGGLITLRLIIQAEYFGRRAFGTIQGIVMAISIIGTMSFPLLTGLYYDVFGNYRLAWFIMAVMLCGCVPAALKAHPPGSHRNMT